MGGDFYDFLRLEDGRIGPVFGNVSGKGIAAAMVMANTQSVPRAAAQREGSVPGLVLEEANRTLGAYIPPNTFATCFYAILDPKNGHLVYANAGHDLPYLWQRDGGSRELGATGMPLGLMPDMSYEEQEATLKVGTASSSAATGWSKPTTLKARCSVSLGLGSWSQSTVRVVGRCSSTTS